MKTEYKWKYRAIKVNGKKRDIHRLIMEKHLKRKLARHEAVHHKNGNTLDNRLENLEIMSISAHARLHMKAYFKKHGFNQPFYQRRASQKGSYNTQAKLNELKVIFIKSQKGIMTRQQLGEQFGVSDKTVWDIWAGRTWAWLDY